MARGFAVWILIMVAETLHGTVRQQLVAPVIGDLRARQVSVFIGSAIIVIITLVFARWLKASRAAHFILIGVMWVALTIAFEILLGRIVLNLSWERIASDYDIGRGGLMAFGMLVLMFAPVMSARVYGEI